MEDSTTRFIVGLLSGYPICGIYFLVVNFIPLTPIYQISFLGIQKETLHNLYFASTGIIIAYWTFGVGMLHGIICILMTWALLQITYGDLLSKDLTNLLGISKDVASFYATGFLFFFELAYLVAGYWGRKDLDSLGTPYDWTTPHCVLCLRLIGLAMDAYDGHRLAQGKELGSVAFQKNALYSKKINAEDIVISPKIPTLLEMTAYVFFVGGYFVGPQFSLNHYRRAVSQSIDGLNRNDPSSSYSPPIWIVVKKLLIGLSLLIIIWLAPFGVPGATHLSTKTFIETKEFCESAFFIRLIYWAFWGQLILTKYVAIWILAEGVMILGGLGYNGRSDDGREILWNGGENVKFPEVYFITTGTDFMKAFNIKTSEWLSLYVFRRLKFARNVILSQAAVCVFVALWHGIEFGYFAVFALLSFSMIFDRFFFAYVKRTNLFQYCVKEYPIFRLIITIIGNICRLYCLPFIPMGFQVHSLTDFIRVGKCIGLQWLLIGYVLVPIVTFSLEKLYVYKYPESNKSSLS